MKYKWSVFCLYQPINDGMIVKNIRTGAVIKLSSDIFSTIQKWLHGFESSLPQEYTESLFGENAFLVSCDLKEFDDCRESFIYTRNEKANLFSLYFLPTTRCQFSCFYCFEKKSTSKDEDMTDGVIEQSARWLSDYLSVNKEVSALRFILFGGESLLRKDIIIKTLPIFNSVAIKKKKDFWLEVITNGELLDSKTGETLFKYNWKRLQITLDGHEEIHNSRRFGKRKKPSFAKKEGFTIPDEFIVGPWCVAIAKHSAVIQPNGTMQKCFCTVGKSQYDFDNVFNQPFLYTKDRRFEMFNRTDDCIKEECVYLPVCGGGCLYNSIVAHGDSGFQKRFCQKVLLDKINKGLLRLNYA